jgi:RNA-binding protein
MIGDKGLTDNVINEIDNALSHHELIKVRISGQEKAERLEVLNAIADKTSSDLVLIIGHIGGFYRPAKEPVIQLPKK